jgi:hypothetical protein
MKGEAKEMSNGASLVRTLAVSCVFWMETHKTRLSSDIGHWNVQVRGFVLGFVLGIGSASTMIGRVAVAGLSQRKTDWDKDGILIDIDLCTVNQVSTLRTELVRRICLTNARRDLRLYRSRF